MVYSVLAKLCLLTINHYRLNPNDVETLIDKSATEENLGLYDQSQESLEKVLQLDPENDDALFSLGLLFQRRANLKKAIEYFEVSCRTGS